MASPSVVTVSIQSDASEYPTEKRYDPNIKIGELKKKLELITGADHTSMKVTLIVDDKDVGVMANGDETLGHYLGIGAARKDSTLKLIVKDEQPSLILQGGDTPKFVISEDKYLQRPNNARNFIKEMREKRMSAQSAGNGDGNGQ